MIPLSVPHLAGNEWQYVKDCLDTGWVSSAGSYVMRFEKMVAEYTGAKYGVATVNGTAALHIALLLSGVRPGDYVLLPNVTFVASANAIKYCGADPILVDANPDNWQIDLDLLEEFLGMNTLIDERDDLVLKKNGRRIRAVMPVHVLGNLCDMERLLFIARRFHLEVVEDATESLGSCYDGRHSGTFGRFGCFSFNGNKIITTGGGGVIVTDEAALAAQARHLTTQAKVKPDEYIHDEIGYNYRLVNVLAAIGVAQMEQLPAFVRSKKEIDALYRQTLDGTGDLRFQEVSSRVDPNCWLFTLRTEHMRLLLEHLRQRGIESRPFWMPMNQLPMFGTDLYIRREDHSNRLYQTCLSIPCSSNLSDEQLHTVTEAIRSFFEY